MVVCAAHVFCLFPWLRKGSLVFMLLNALMQAKDTKAAFTLRDPEDVRTFLERVVAWGRCADLSPDPSRCAVIADSYEAS